LAILTAAVLLLGAFAAAGQTTESLFVAPIVGKSATTRLADKSVPAKTHVARQRAVGINFKSLEPRAGRQSLTLNVDLFDSLTVQADFDRLEVRGAQNYTWFGSVRGLPNSRATLTVVNGILAGHLVLLDDLHRVKGTYQIEAANDGGYALQEVDQSAFPADHPPSLDLKAPKPTSELNQPSRRTTERATGTTTIDVMVVYSAETAIAAGTAIGAQIQAAVDSANTIYTNSGINARLRLVYSGPAGYNQSGDFYTDLNRLTSTSDGVMDNVHTLRDTYGADLVSLWIETATYCGLGWIGPYAPYGFTVVNRGCATSNSTFAHEIGHNIGALHDPYVDSSVNPYAYGHGLVNVAAKWRTVMAYNDQCAAAGTSCTRIPYFSNPALAYNGAALGTAEAGTTPTSDNTRVHNNGAATVASFRPTVVGAACTYTLSPTAASPTSSGGSATVSVTTQSGCTWSASSSAAWLTISSGASGTGSGTVTYASAPNTGAARSATLTVGGKTVTVNQAAACSYALSPTSASLTATAGSGSVAVTVATGCTWTATSSASWLTVTSGASGNGNGTIGYAAVANTGPTRSANLTIGGQTFMVTQANGCTYTASPTSVSAVASSGSGSIGVTAGTGCTWTASSNASWLTVTSAASGSGNGNVGYSAAANTGAARSGTLTVGGNAVTVSQAALACSYTLAPANGSFAAVAGAGNVTVTAPTGCTWTSSSSASWLTVNSGASGNGNGAVVYAAAANAGPARTASLTIGGTMFTVAQASGCTYLVSPSSISVAVTGASGTLAITSATGCVWTASSGASWLTVTSGATGSGGGSIGYSAAANAGAARTTALTIGGRTVTVDQVAAPAVAAPTGTNVALASAGAVATASSAYSGSYPASAVINDDRTGAKGYWNDQTFAAFPDWVQVVFSGTKAIDRVVVHTLQDNYLAATEPTDTQTFSLYGVTDFTVQGWDGSAWVTLGTVTGNNLVKRTVNFSTFTTDRIRINVNGSKDGYWSRIAEIEAWGTSTQALPVNVALASTGAVASASSSYGNSYPASAINNGERTGGKGYWNDQTFSVFPDWVEIAFSGTKTINRVVVYTLQDDYLSPIEPTDTMTFARFGVTDFTVQGWTGFGWVTLATANGNNLVKRTVTFAGFTTDRIRINVNGTKDAYWSRITEVEAWGT
jgi:hypothetical protein